MNYLKATPIEVGLLLNFGDEPEFKRYIYTNDRKVNLKNQLNPFYQWREYFLNERKHLY